MATAIILLRVSWLFARVLVREFAMIPFLNCVSGKLLLCQIAEALSNVLGQGIDFGLNGTEKVPLLVLVGSQDGVHEA